ncbi:helix-turn-helix domain-containing protein [Actinoplanes sp. NPDC051859]|uniref:helix-turn-helix domain-containing protein n=1 Tax=Actinoplanes sp. NPDC051859 TaxID=3363909 RepID=UPI00379D2186
MYAERSSALPHVVAWTSVTPPGGTAKRILPDGCLDVIWSQGAVFIAGPDTSAQLTTSPSGSRHAGLQFAVGTGAAVLGVPADELTDRRVPLSDVLAPTQVRPLAEAENPLAALESFARRRWRTPDPTMVAVTVGARAGRPVSAIAAACGLSERQLHRRCQPVFGYGPKTLARILRLERAIGLARRGRPFAEVAVTTGYADQAHLARDVRALAGTTLTELMS